MLLEHSAYDETPMKLRIAFSEEDKGGEAQFGKNFCAIQRVHLHHEEEHGELHGGLL